MPWEIHIALAVLWGVCWMFYEDLVLHNTEQDYLQATNNATTLFEGIISGNPFLGSYPDLDIINYDMFMQGELQSELPSLEQQLERCVSCSVTTFDIPITLTPVPVPTVSTTANSVNPQVINYGYHGGIIATAKLPSSHSTSAIQEVVESEQIEATESDAPGPVNAPLICTHTQIQDNQIISSRNSKHGQTEKQFCIYSNCSRSQPGSGFHRKDHLDQHLRGVHKQGSVPRLRAKPAVVLSSFNSAATSETPGAFLQSKKRRHRRDDPTDWQDKDELFEELAEERRLRLLAQQENNQLRQKIENYEGRMQKYEERLDRMMALFEGHKGEGKT
ncbi:hypothetical protein B7463_g11968, partial [Scytalidium lignicola]